MLGEAMLGESETEKKHAYEGELRSSEGRGCDVCVNALRRFFLHPAWLSTRSRADGTEEAV